MLSTCLLIAFVGTFIVWDRWRTESRIRHRQDVESARVILTAAIAYGLPDNTIFHDFSAHAAVHAAHEAGIKVDNVVGAGIPLHTGLLVGYGVNNGVVFAEIKRGTVVDSVPLFTLTP